MMQRIECESAFVLHTRAYLETSLIVELITENHGRVGVVAKGAKRPKSRGRGVLQAFVPLLVSFRGRGELLTLTGFEVNSQFNFRLEGRSLMSAFYVNELMMRLIPRFAAHSDLFQIYGKTLIELDQSKNEEVTLRLFEKSLLSALGYELQLTRDCASGKSVAEDKFYHFDPESGPFELESQAGLNQMTGVVWGKSLLDLNKGILEDPKTLLDAKRLMRRALALHLGDKPLESRRLF